MMIIEANNVNDAYAQGLRALLGSGVLQGSRAGYVLALPYPVMTIYNNPCERVLFDSLRDANPFFHLFEALWMLAGRSDSAFLNRYVKDFGSRFAEPDGRIHDAYGERWRRHWDHDQLLVATNRLRHDPQDRRIVLAMWDVSYDLFDVDEDQPRGVPCNTHIYLRVVNGALDLTVMCRSNDAIWGAHGANAVHFSVLQEYLAAAVGVRVGTMYQFSNNYHGYVDVLAKLRPDETQDDPYSGDVVPTPLVTDPDAFLSECEVFCEHPLKKLPYRNEFMRTTALSMSWAHNIWRHGGRADALAACDDIAASDWRLACQQWMQRRMK